MSLFQSFHSLGEFDSRFFEAFIYLNLNIKSLGSLNDFSPISLLSWFHKLITKVLSGRLRTVINHLVSQSQSSFIHGRSIHDRWIITYEVLDAIKKEKQDLVFKLDFEKAYDRVR